MKIFLLFLVCFFVDANGQRIAGGIDVPISDYPFAASLLTNGGVNNAEFTHACGGTILTASALLSAASCFHTNAVVNDPSWWRARVGSSSTTAGGTIYNINTIFVHPQFAAATRANDVAVIRTTIPMALVPNSVEAARIAGAAYTFATNQQVFAIGWGAVDTQADSPSDQLRRVQIWTISQETCANRYNAIGFTVTSDMVCVGWLDVGIRGQCPGDYGSPILDNDGGVVGIFTWAEGCANSWFPDVNTRVSSYTSWIVSAATA